ncbi:MAG: amidohydrolase [Desulfobacteraceae bacterium]|nr:amidohydrolase [Desulfobacteraceae bacterium]
MDDLVLTIVQESLAWEDIDRNLETFDGIVNAIREDTRMVVLPEMFTTGFTLDSPELAQTMEGSGVAWMQAKAREKGADMVGSLMIREEGRLFNRLIWATATGELYWYDKRHLFRHAGETRHFTPGTRHLVVDVDGWKISAFICYDLRFPCWTRNRNNGYDLALFVANWPAPRAFHWNTLLTARAIENQAYVVGVNRVGTDNNGLSYQGDSSVINPKGEVLFQKSHDPVVQTMTLSHDFLESYRSSFPVWMDSDPV